MNHPPFRTAVLLVALCCDIQTRAMAFGAPETSSDRTFDPKDVPKLVVVVVGDSRGMRDFQSDQQRVVEDEFVRVLLGKGFSVNARSDLPSVTKEQMFQGSGLTSPRDRAALGKILNVPAVMVVRVTQFSAEMRRNPRTRMPYVHARAMMGARLISLETGTILWTATYDQAGDVASRVEASRALTHVAKGIATAFPDLKPSEPKPAPKPAKKSQGRSK